MGLFFYLKKKEHKNPKAPPGADRMPPSYATVYLVLYTTSIYRERVQCIGCHGDRPNLKWPSEVSPTKDLHYLLTMFKSKLNGSWALKGTTIFFTGLNSLNKQGHREHRYVIRKIRKFLDYPFQPPMSMTEWEATSDSLSLAYRQVWEQGAGTKMVRSIHGAVHIPTACLTWTEDTKWHCHWHWEFLLEMEVGTWKNCGSWSSTEVLFLNSMFGYLLFQLHLTSSCINQLDKCH